MNSPPDCFGAYSHHPRTQDTIRSTIEDFDEERLVEDLAAKLSPKRFPGMSPFMAAVVGYVLGQSFTDPEIVEITVSESEGLVYIRRAGAVVSTESKAWTTSGRTGTA